MSDDPNAQFLLANNFKRAGQLNEAIAAYQRAISLRPDFVEAWNNLANTLKLVGRMDEAMDAYQRAIALRPGDSQLYFNLGNTFNSMERMGEAIAAYRQALSVRPEDADVWVNLGNAQRESAQSDEAIACYRRAIELSGHPIAAGNLLYTLYLHADSTPRQIAEEHRRWNERYAKPPAAFIEPHPNDPSPDRRLRVGYVSHDLSMHPVGRFMLPLLSHHDHKRFEIFCYADGPVDAMTGRLRSCADVWRNTEGWGDEQLADLIRQDRIDILVDLTMHTIGSRLLAFARKPAPVQVTYLAYAGTTGLETMDYRLTDPYLDPPSTSSGQAPGSNESLYREKSVRLRSYWCCEAPGEAPPVNASPFTASGKVTFGCLNKYNKVSRQTLSMWSQILRETPHSRLLVLSPHGPHRDQAKERFAAEGVSPERLEFVERTPLPEYFRRYQQIDIALDPFPCGGGTTTCDALWMGVPVVSLAGQTAVSRGGLSILSHIGVPELVAHDPAQYVRIAVELAKNSARLKTFRSTLRDRMRASPLMDAAAFARDVEGAFCKMWRNWCSGIQSSPT